MPLPFGAVIGALLISQLRRVCPKCGAEIVVRLEEKNQPINCFRCGEAIPSKDGESKDAH